MRPKPLETDYGRDLQARVTIAWPSVRLFRRNTGTIKLEDRVFRAGIPGQCDYWAIDRTGKHYEIEIKNVRTPFTQAQEAWRAWCVEWNVPWILLRVRAGEVPVETVARWMGELRVFFGVQ